MLRSAGWNRIPLKPKEQADSARHPDLITEQCRLGQPIAIIVGPFHREPAVEGNGFSVHQKIGNHRFYAMKLMSPSPMIEHTLVR